MLLNQTLTRALDFRRRIEIPRLDVLTDGCAGSTGYQCGRELEGPASVSLQVVTTFSRSHRTKLEVTLEFAQGV